MPCHLDHTESKSVPIIVLCPTLWVREKREPFQIKITKGRTISYSKSTMCVTTFSRITQVLIINQSTWETPGFKEYHRRLQLFVLLYIEGGSYISEDEDSWEFVVLWAVPWVGRIFFTLMSIQLRKEEAEGITDVGVPSGRLLISLQFLSFSRKSANEAKVRLRQ